MVQNWENSTSRPYIVPLLFNSYAEYIMGNVRLDESQAGIKIAGGNINNLRYADDTLAPWKKSYDQPRQHIKKQKQYFANKGPSSQSSGFSSSHVWM